MNVFKATYLTGLYFLDLNLYCNRTGRLPDQLTVSLFIFAAFKVTWGDLTAGLAGGRRHSSDLPFTPTLLVRMTQGDIHFGRFLTQKVHVGRRFYCGKAHQSTAPTFGLVPGYRSGARWRRAARLSLPTLRLVLPDAWITPILAVSASGVVLRVKSRMMRGMMAHRWKSFRRTTVSMAEVFSE